MLHDFSPFAVASLTAASVVLLLAATATDLAFRRVPNMVSALLTLSGLVLRALSGSLLAGLIAALAVFAMATFCWRRGWLGGGDVKLLAAATLSLPPLLTPSFLLAVALAGGALALLYLALSALQRASGSSGRGAGVSALPSGVLRERTGMMRFIQRLLRIERWRIRQRGSLPYAAAIAAGAFFVLIKQ